MRNLFHTFDRNGNWRVDKHELVTTFEDMSKYFTSGQIERLSNKQIMINLGTWTMRNSMHITLAK